MMDHRSVEWLHLLPAHDELIIGNAPPSFSNLFAERVTPGTSNGATYVGWRPSPADLPNLGQFASVAMLNPRGVDVATLEQAGFRHTCAYSALPSLNDTRWLVPLGRGRVTVTSLGLVDPWRFRDRVKKQILVGAAGLGQLPRFGDVLLLARTSTSHLEMALEARLGCSPIFLALKTGPPRTMRKTTIQVMDREGDILAYVKLATSPDARLVVQREIDCLRDLAAHPPLANAISRLLGTIDSPGYFASVLAPGPVARGPATFGEPHQSFLRAMASSTGRAMSFQQSAMWKDMDDKLNRLGPRLPPAWQSRLDASMRVLNDALGSRELLLSTAHRDFGQWNTRLNADGSLYVFDWDGARREMTPLYDLIGFHFLHYGKLVRSDSHIEALSRILDACRQWGTGANRELAPYLFLAYLTESALSRLFGALWRFDVDTDQILGSIASLLDNQSEWLPSQRLVVAA